MSMRTLVVAIALGSAAALVSAAENPRHKKEMRAIREVVEENFRTSNTEDLTGCMAAMTPYMPNREEFVSQLKEFFEDTDVYIRLVDLQFVSAEMADHGPVAIVRVTQQTITRGGRRSSLLRVSYA